MTEQEHGTGQPCVRALLETSEPNDSQRLAELIKISRKMATGASRSALFPEIEEILASRDAPDVGDLDRWETAFGERGYRLYQRHLPKISVSAVFEIVQAADIFKRRLRAAQERGECSTAEYEALTRQGLSIGTPPVTESMRTLVGELFLGLFNRSASTTKIRDSLPLEGDEQPVPAEMLALLNEMIDGSLHYNTAAEEQAFYRDAGAFDGLNVAHPFCQVALTESPQRCIEIIQSRLFNADRESNGGDLRLIEAPDRVDGDLLTMMEESAATIFVVRISRLPALFSGAPKSAETSCLDPRWKQAIGRLILVEDSQAARRTNVTFVYSLFPQVVETLRTIQTCIAGRPANTQLGLRRIVERFSAEELATMRANIVKRRARLCRTPAGEIHQHDRVMEATTLVRMERLLIFLHTVASASENELGALGEALRESVKTKWMSYFYESLPTDSYPATVVSGGGRGALVLIGDYHALMLREAAKQVLATHGTAYGRYDVDQYDESLPSGENEDSRLIFDTIRALREGHYRPSIILPQMSWTYGDVFPNTDTLRIRLNDHYELDPIALKEHLVSRQRAFAQMPELFELYCKSLLLVLNSPHNPSAVVYRRSTLVALLDLAAEYDLCVVDDNSYHRLVTEAVERREGMACLAELYEAERDRFPRALRIFSAGATTKGMQGAGDRTGLLHANQASVIGFAEEKISAPHLMSLYLTELKLELGLSVRQYQRLLAENSKEIARDPKTVGGLLAKERESMYAGDFSALGYLAFALVARVYEGAADGVAASDAELRPLRLELKLRADIEERLAQALCAAREVGSEVIVPGGGFYLCMRLCDPDDEYGLPEFLRAIARHRKVDVTRARKGFVRLSLGGALPGDPTRYQELYEDLKTYLGLLLRYWREFCARGRKINELDRLFDPQRMQGAAELSAEEPLSAAELDRIRKDFAPRLTR